MIARTIEARINGEELLIQHKWVPYEQISSELVNAVINAEDAHFYEHRGFDLEAIRYAKEMNERYGYIIGLRRLISTRKSIGTYRTYC